jgi:hypothetical protein
MKTMLTAIANVLCFFVIELPNMVWVSVNKNLEKWWYSHYH